MMYNSLCRDSQDTKALCFPEAANIHNSIIVGKVPFTSRRESLADYLDNGSACGGHFVMDSGIYKITNMVTGDFYIGSSVNLCKRFQTHRSYLVGNRHANTFLQNSWNKYGEQAFEFAAVLLCDKSMALFFEQLLIDGLKPTFNIAPYVHACNRGRLLTEEHKRKISETRTGYICSEIATQHNSESHKDKPNGRLGKHHTEETKRRMSDAQKRRFAKTRAQTKSLLQIKST